MKENAEVKAEEAGASVPKKEWKANVGDLEDSDLWPDGIPPRTPYTDGWAEDEWEKEMEKHPFFMTKSPELGEELPPLLEGLQQLKYDENENSPEELASSYKDEGNHQFKHKKYSNAIANYTAGLKYNCSKELRSQLLNNRSAAHFYLGNYRSSWNDCREVLKLNPNYSKAQNRVAQCMYHLKYFEDCIAVCNDILSKDENNSDIKILKKNAMSEKKMQDRDMRKKSKLEKADVSRDDKTMELIKERGLILKLKDTNKINCLSDLNPPRDLPIHLDRVYYEDGRLFWPVLFTFPELELIWPINEFDEHLTLSFMLLHVRDELQEYDSEYRYKPSNVRFYYKSKDLVPIEANADVTLAVTMQDPRFCIESGLLRFFVFLKNSATETDFQKKCVP